jgi:geranylgeranyl reductase family protein
VLKVHDNEVKDVIIIGAGPAGTAAAREIKNSGYSVVLIDKETFPRKKTCAGVLPPRIYSELDIPNEICERKLFGYRLYSPSGKIVESTFTRRRLIVERSRFDEFLVERLHQKVLHLNVVNLNLHNDCIEVVGKNRSYRGKIAVGADGVNSIVRKSCEISLNTIAIAAQFDVLLPKDVITNRIGNWFEVYYFIPFGYGWISPLKDKLKVGIGGVSQDLMKNTKESLYKFMEHPIVKTKIKDGKIENFELHRIPMSGPLDQLVAERRILVGDAGGFVYPGTGEGVYYAIKSGRLAGGVIVEALDKQRFDQQFLGESYNKKLEANGLFSLREVDFVKKVLSSSENIEKYIRKLQKFTNRSNL